MDDLIKEILAAAAKTDSVSPTGTLGLTLTEVDVGWRASVSGAGERLTLGGQSFQSFMDGTTVEKAIKNLHWQLTRSVANAIKYAEANKLTYSIIRHFADGERETIETGLSLTEAQAWCKDPETSSRTCTSEERRQRTEKCGPWFEGYTEE